MGLNPRLDNERDLLLLMSCGPASEQGMYGVRGVLKADYAQPLAYNVTASALRLDDVVELAHDQPVCMLKADVEGYEVSRRTETPSSKRAR